MTASAFQQKSSCCKICFRYKNSKLPNICSCWHITFYLLQKP